MLQLPSHNGGPSHQTLSIAYIDCFLLLLVTKSKEREQSPSGGGGPAAKEQKTPQGTAKGGKAKGGKDKAEKADKTKAGGATSRPASVTFDVGKPHWTLRVVSDAPAAVSITRNVLLPFL